MSIMSISMSNTSDSINKTIVDNISATNPKVSSTMFIRMVCHLCSAPVNSSLTTFRDYSFSAKMGFLRVMTTRVFMTVYHSPSHLCVDNSWYIALYAVICFLKLNSF